MKITIDGLCLLSSIIDKVEINDEFINEMIKIGETAKGKETKEQERIKTQIGLKLFLKISSKMHLVKEELIEFISSAKEITKEEAKKEDVLKFIKEILNDEGIQNFLSQKVMSE